MALTDEDIVLIRGVVREEVREGIDEAIAVHPRFDQMKRDIIDEVSEVYRDGLELIGKRFDNVEQRLEKLEHRHDDDEPWRRG